jgi:hypothetical protein
VMGDVIMQWRWQRWLNRDLVVSFASLLAEDFEVVLHICEPYSLSVDALSTSFDALHCGLPSQNGFLFLSKPLDLLLTLASSSSSAADASSSASSSQSSIWT